MNHPSAVLLNEKHTIGGDAGESELIQFNWDRNIFTVQCLAEAYTEQYNANDNNNNEMKFLLHERISCSEQ